MIINFYKENKKMFNMNLFHLAREKKARHLSPEYNKYDSTNGFIGALLAPVLVSLVFMIILMFVSGFVTMSYEEFVESKAVTIISILVGQLAFLFFILWYNKRENKKFTKAFKFKKVNVLILLIAIAIGLIMLFGTNDFIYLTDHLLRLTGYSKSTDLPFVMDSVGNLILGLVLMAVIPGVVEELMFRGMILGGMLKGLNTWKQKIISVVLSALIFALVHGSAQQFVFPFIMGIVFGSVYLLTDNLWYTIAMHCCNNGLVVLLNYLATVGGQGSEVAITINVGYVFTAIGFLLLSLALFAGLIYLIYIITNKRAKVQQSIQEGVEIIAEDAVDGILEDEKQITEISQAEERVNKIKLWMCYGYAVINVIIDIIMYCK